jgi:hypothetical protein
LRRWHTVSELLGDGGGNLALAATYALGSSPSAVVVGDFNGDGRPDVSTANTASGTISVLHNDGTWTLPPPLPRHTIDEAPTVTEGNTGNRTVTFTVALSAAST